MTNKNKLTKDNIWSLLLKRNITNHMCFHFNDYQEMLIPKWYFTESLHMPYEISEEEFCIFSLYSIHNSKKENKWKSIISYNITDKIKEKYTEFNPINNIKQSRYKDKLFKDSQMSDIGWLLRKQLKNTICKRNFLPEWEKQFYKWVFECDEFSLYNKEIMNYLPEEKEKWANIYGKYWEFNNLTHMELYEYIDDKLLENYLKKYLHNWYYSSDDIFLENFVIGALQFLDVEWIDLLSRVDTYTIEWSRYFKEIDNICKTLLNVALYIHEWESMIQESHIIARNIVKALKYMYT